MSTIPDIRLRLHELGDELGVPELHDLAEATRRRFHGRRQVFSKAPALTEDQTYEVRRYAELNPLVAHQDIADRFGVNIGRVSEALFGKRE